MCSRIFPFLIKRVGSPARIFRIGLYLNEKYENRTSIKEVPAIDKIKFEMLILRLNAKLPEIVPSKAPAT